jgi:S-DNA-T family DNA segregation ATPase FtsK/SpoIIIE
MVGPPSVMLAPWQTLGEAEPLAPQCDEDGPTDLQRLVSAIGSAAARRRLVPPPPPWLPPLPRVLTVDDLDSRGHPAGPATPEGRGEPSLVPLGLADRPTEQRQETFGLDFADGGSLLIAGGARSGRSSTLRALAGSIALRYPVDDVHLYAIDCGSGALHLVADLPHCGALVRRDELARGGRVLALLLEEVRRRQEQLAGVGSVAEQRAGATAEARLPWLLLLVDGWEAFAAAYEAVDHGRPVTTLLTLAREGPGVGLKLAVTSDRQGLLTRLGTAFPDKLLLRLTDRLDYGLAGIPTRAIPEDMPAGRGLLADGAVEVQVALLDRDPGGSAQAAALARIVAAATARAATDPPHRRPFRVRPLPRLVRLVDLDSEPAGASGVPARALAHVPRLSAVDRPDRTPVAGSGKRTGRARPAPASRPFRTLLGVGGDDAAPIGVDLAEYGPGFLIAGPPRSGRSTALCALTEGLQAAGTPVVLVTPARSPLGSRADNCGAVASLGPADVTALTAALAVTPTAVLVDDITGLPDSAVDRALTDLLHRGGDGHVVVVAGRNDDLAATFRGTATEVRRSRAGLLLCPSWTDGELLSTRLPRGDPEAVAGRGILVGGGCQTPIQVAVGSGAGSAGLGQAMWG